MKKDKISKNVYEKIYKAIASQKVKETLSGYPSDEDLKKEDDISSKLKNDMLNHFKKLEQKKKKRRRNIVFIIAAAIILLLLVFVFTLIAGGIRLPNLDLDGDNTGANDQDENISAGLFEKIHCCFSSSLAAPLAITSICRY